MQGPTSSLNFRTVANVSLAYFADYRGVSDSIRDLCTAGFEARNINISQSAAEQKTHPQAEAAGPLPNAIGAHSKLWLWDQYRKHDRQRSGADQMSGLNPTPSEGANPTCSSFNLQGALSAMHVPPVVITLLLRDVQSHGMFMLVDADGRVDEADSILDKNAGLIRTQHLR
jgi:hypothetical protein